MGTLETPILTGTLYKKCRDTLRFKERWCKLFASSIQIYSADGKKMKMMVSVRNIVVCERVEKDLVDRNNVMQVVFEQGIKNGKPFRINSLRGTSTDKSVLSFLYLSADYNINQWLETIGRMVEKSVDKGQHTRLYTVFHRGVYLGSKWNCCHKNNIKDEGCKGATLSVAKRLSMSVNKLNTLGSSSLDLQIPPEMDVVEEEPERHMFDEEDVWGEGSIF
ncbi:hypothetical protein ACHWQZ_G017320 [Mnemiopsis leidyi]